MKTKTNEDYEAAEVQQTNKIYRNGDTEENIIIQQHIHYHYRSLELDNLTFLEYCCIIIIKLIPKDEKKEQIRKKKHPKK